MSIEELEDLRSEMGDQRYEEQPSQLNQYKESDARNDYQHHHQSQYQSQQQGYPRDQEDVRRSSLHHQQSSGSLMSRSGSISRLSVSSYNPVIQQESRTNHTEEIYNNNRTSVSSMANNRSSYYDDSRSTISEYRPQYRTPSTTSLFRSSVGGGGGYPDLGRHGGIQRGRSRNSNILSSILCLIKEIDIPSLEVVEMAVRCRMEELED